MPVPLHCAQSGQHRGSSPASSSYVAAVQPGTAAFLLSLDFAAFLFRAITDDRNGKL